MLVGVAWALWLAGWVRRVELHHRWEPTVTALGLRWLPHGLRARVSAAGEVAGRRVEIAWAHGAIVIVREGRAERLPGGTSAEELAAVLSRTPSAPG